MAVSRSRNWPRRG